MSDQKAAAATDAPRTVHTFKVPPKLQCFGTKEVSIAELTVGEEEMAYSRGGGGASARSAIELARQALFAVDGVRVHTGDFSAEAAFDRLHPKIRTLVLQAFVSVHQPPADDAADFLASCVTSVG